MDAAASAETESAPPALTPLPTMTAVAFGGALCSECRVLADERVADEGLDEGEEDVGGLPPDGVEGEGEAERVAGPVDSDEGTGVDLGERSARTVMSPTMSRELRSTPAVAPPSTRFVAMMPPAASTKPSPVKLLPPAAVAVTSASARIAACSIASTSRFAASTVARNECGRHVALHVVEHHDGGDADRRRRCDVQTLREVVGRADGLPPRRVGVVLRIQVGVGVVRAHPLVDAEGAARHVGPQRFVGVVEGVEVELSAGPT